MENGSYISEYITTIPVAFHIVSDDNLSWTVQENTLYQQLNILREAFPYYITGFSFTIYSIDITQNTNWSNSMVNHGDMKETLAIDPIHILNIYVCNQIENQGYATFPWDYPLVEPFMSGVVIHKSTLPGSNNIYGYTEGDVAVHEVGHFLGCCILLQMVVVQVNRL